MDQEDADQEDADQERVSATLTIAASAEQVFAVLADPVRHAAIDGTGWVEEPVDREPLTAPGQVFRMAMYLASRGVNYQTANVVQHFDPPRTISWWTGTEHDDGALELGGWVWRYDLVPVGPSETEVTLSYDWSEVPQLVRDRGIPFPPFGPDHLPRSLAHLAELATKD
ncbi:SRPBCC family protein [Catenulispora yoronensis]